MVLFYFSSYIGKLAILRDMTIIILGLDEKVYLFIHLFEDFIYLFMRDTEREAETQTEGEAGSPREDGCKTRSQNPGITT